MKKIIILICCLFLNGCLKDTTKITLNDNLNIEYGETIYLNDLVKIEDGSLITKNYKIDSYKLGTKTIKIKYKNSNHWRHEYKFQINIVDTTPPLILSSVRYSTIKGEDVDLCAKPLIGDNYDINPKCKVEGVYDINAVGEYNLKFIATDQNNNTSEQEFKFLVKNKSSNKPSTTESDNYLISDLVKKYKTDKTMIGIDVSSWQKDIDYDKVKDQGVEFVIIRMGFGHNKDNELVLDKYFKENLTNAKKAGLKVGVYFFSYATTIKESNEQSNWVIKNLNGEKLDLPIAYDWENWQYFNDYNINLVALNDVAKTFMDNLKKYNYEVMNYSSVSYLKYVWNLKDYPTWLAYYGSNPNYDGNYYIWQISDRGKVDGINTDVDLNILYKKD